MFERTTYIQRREALSKQVSNGLLIIPGNGDNPGNYTDNIQPFRQDSSFLYFFGIDLPDLVGIIDLDTGETTLFGDDPSLDAIVWTGPLPSLAEQADRVGVTRTAPLGDIASVLRQARQAGRTLHLPPQYRAQNRIRLSEWIGISLAELDNLTSPSACKAIIDIRAVKSAAEIANIEQVLSITKEMHLIAMRMAQPGATEQAIVGAMEGYAWSHGCRQSYAPILSKRGEVLHNHYHHNTLRAGDLLLNDSGAESPMHYASDITRTIPVGGRFDERQRAIYQTVLNAQLAAIDALKPGVPYLQVYELAAGILVDGLKQFGLFKGDTDEIIRTGAFALIFPHGLGHLMGLDVHDMEALNEDWVGYGEGYERSRDFGRKSLRLARPVRAGWVVTIEPGIYFIPALIDRWRAEGRFTHLIDYAAFDAFRNFGGIRIEDDVLITDTGSRVLGDPIPRTIEEVEAATQR
ncbi:Xaa-Pro aminopeptidase [Chitinivorax tropicus]|uniref:Xaa-Pro aminopeptidase n=1 Tax=Chitinivorax tropicus TaxID=714531 RepID=A0A840MK78_9PROT|nr:aminopeptidase P family protein [Chitinivorax tropicus]MBB5019058.1 Xaa-Pro aminopeptidase [Chitinivorax tropicus]